jgi:hypothetical protein
VNAKPEAAAAQPPRPAYRKPNVGDIVHFFDDTRAQQYAQPGVGPYAAIVTMLGPVGVQLEVFGPNGGRFYAERVPHKSELRAEDKSRKKWWQWPHEGRAAGDPNK